MSIHNVCRVFLKLFSSIIITLRTEVIYVFPCNCTFNIYTPCDLWAAFIRNIIRFPIRWYFSRMLSQRQPMDYLWYTRKHGLPLFPPISWRRVTTMSDCGTKLIWLKIVDNKILYYLIIKLLLFWCTWLYECMIVIKSSSYLKAKPCYSQKIEFHKVRSYKS
jgi:hypothetical protein